MKGINERLIDWAKQSSLIQSLGWYNESTADLLRKALDENETTRFNATNNLSKLIWKDFPEIGICPNLFLLRKAEDSHIFYDDYRDHSTHMFKVYLLGLYIYENNAIIKRMFDNDEGFIHCWTITSLWHDMGYLFENKKITEVSELWKEISNDINEQFKCSLNSIFGTDVGASRWFFEQEEVKCAPLKNEITHIENDDVLFGYLEYASKASGLCSPDAINKIYTVLRGFDTPKGVSMHIDHGIFGALLLLKTWLFYKSMLDDIIKVSQDKPTCEAVISIKDVLPQISTVQNSIVDLGTQKTIEEAARAIALHNIKKDSIDYRKLMPININKFRIVATDEEEYKAQPFAYLLRIVDELQDWDRQKFMLMEKEKPILRGSEVDIIASADVIAVCYKEDAKYANPEEDGSRFSEIKKAIADHIALDGLLIGIRESEIPADYKVEESRKEFQSIFFGRTEIELMKHIARISDFNEIIVMLFNRAEHRLVVLHPNGIITPIPDKKTHQFLMELYLNGHSKYIEDPDSRERVAYALISTYVGPLGFLVLKDFCGVRPTNTEVTINHLDIANMSLNDLGVMYGSLVFSSIQKKIHKKAITDAPFITDVGFDSDDDSGYYSSQLTTQLNDYIPFGHNPCISVFLDVRGLSNLFNGNRNYEKRTLEFVRVFSEIVDDVSKNHYGIVTSNFGGGMLITFNQIIREELNISCFRAICTMNEMRKKFHEELIPIAVKLFGEDRARMLDIGMGASAGEAIYSTLGCYPSIFYTGIGKNVSYAKKIENISGREKPLSKDKFYISKEVYYLCNERSHGIKIREEKGNLPYSKEVDTLYYIECSSSDNDGCAFPEKSDCCCIDTSKCPIQRRCKYCTRVAH